MGAVGRRCLEREVGLLQPAQALDARCELRGEGGSELLVGPAEALAAQLIHELDDGDHL